MSLRVAVSGAHGVGKTTFCSDLQSSLQSMGGKAPRVHLCTEVARALQAEGIPINRGTEEWQYALFFQRHLSNLVVDHMTDYVIYDRTMLDSLSYAVVNNNLHESWVEFVISLFAELSKRIDVYFFIPIEFALESDGV